MVTMKRPRVSLNVQQHSLVNLGGDAVVVSGELVGRQAPLLVSPKVSGSLGTSLIHIVHRM
jgi:hypothetical protein